MKQTKEKLKPFTSENLWQQEEQEESLFIDCFKNNE